MELLKNLLPLLLDLGGLLLLHQPLSLVDLEQPTLVDLCLAIRYSLEDFLCGKNTFGAATTEFGPSTGYGGANMYKVSPHRNIKIRVKPHSS